MSIRTVLGVLSALPAGAGFFLWPWIGILEITAVSTGQVRWCARMGVDDAFILSFTHSVNKRPVYDTLRTQGEHIVIVKSRFDAFGAGMPEASTEQGTLTVLPDGWLEWTVNRVVPEVIVRVGRVADHHLFLKGRDIPLVDLAEPGSALAFRARRVSLVSAMKGRCIP